jgi:glycosyltransferase involved in cell wall biosynthesis
MRLRVLFLWYDLYQVGGVETDMWLLGRYLPQFGVEPYFLQMQGAGPLSGRFATLKDRILTIPYPAFTSHKRCHRAWAQAAAAIEADVVVINDRFGWEILPWLRPQTQVAVIYHIFDRGSVLRQRAREWAPRIAAHIANSEVTAEQLHEGLPDHRHRIHVVHCGIDVPAWQDCNKPDLTERVNVLYAGRLVEAQKRVLNLAPLVAALGERLGDRVHVTIAGDGADVERLRAALVGLPERWVTLTGPVGPERVDALQRAAHFWVSFSDHEGIPMSLREALASGAVPVTTRAEGVPDAFLSEGVDARHFPLDRPDIAADIIAELANDPARWTRMSVAARRLGEQRDGRAMARDYARVLLEAHAHRPAARQSQVRSAEPVEHRIGRLQAGVERRQARITRAWRYQEQALAARGQGSRWQALALFGRSLVTESQTVLTRRTAGCLRRILLP